MFGDRRASLALNVATKPWCFDRAAEQGCARKRRNMELFLALAVISIQGLSAAAESTTLPQAFGGTWALDSARSVLYGGVKRELELAVAIRSATMTVRERRPSAEDEYSVIADGRPHEHTVAGAVFSRTVRRETDDLVFHVTMTRLADKASIRYTERWTISDAGRTLTIHTEYPGGRDVLKVFARKD